MGRVSTCQKNCKTIDLRGAQVNETSLVKLYPGPRFNLKMSSYQYRKSHCGDKTVVRSSYLHNGISYTGKMSSLYWIGAQGFNTSSASLPSYPSNCLQWKTPSISHTPLWRLGRVGALPPIAIRGCAALPGRFHSQTTPWAPSHPILHPRAGWLPLRPHSAVAWLAAGRLIIF